MRCWQVAMAQLMATAQPKAPGQAPQAATPIDSPSESLSSTPVKGGKGNPTSARVGGRCQPLALLMLAGFETACRISKPALCAGILAGIRHIRQRMHGSPHRALGTGQHATRAGSSNVDESPNSSHLSAPASPATPRAAQSQSPLRDASAAAACFGAQSPLASPWTKAPATSTAHRATRLRSLTHPQRAAQRPGTGSAPAPASVVRERLPASPVGPASTPAGLQ